MQFIYLVGLECYVLPESSSTTGIYVFSGCTPTANALTSLCAWTVSSICLSHVWTVNIQTTLCARTVLFEQSHMQ